MLKKFLRDSTGNTAMVFALATPLMMTIGSAAIDFAAYSGASAEYQDIADTAALAGARQFALSMDHNDDPQGTSLMETVARNTAERMLANSPQGVSANVSVTVDTDNLTVSVHIDQTNNSSILGNFTGNTLDIDVEATALSAGSGKTCVIAFEEGENFTLQLEGNGRISGQDCGVFTNSDKPNSMSVKGSASITASKICSAGGYQGADYVPIPETECPLREDPIADINPRDGITTPITTIPFGALNDCDEHNHVIRANAGEIIPLDPNTYCLGLTIEGEGTVALNGLYVISDATLTIRDSVRVTAFDTTLYFLGENSELRVEPNASLFMEAPREGEMAGILMFQDRESGDNSKFIIESNDTRKLVGTIYLPNGQLIIDTNAEVAQESAYTAILADTVHIKNNSNLVLNSDYSATDVPVPKGITGDNPIRLLR